MTTGADFSKLVAEMAVRNAGEAVDTLLREAGATAQTPAVLPDRAAVERAAEQILTQDPMPTSRRVWSAVLGVATAIMLTPEVQTALLALLGTWVDPIYLPLATALMAALLASLSKRADLRPVRGR